MRFASFALIAASGARADYQFTTYHDALDCTGNTIQTVANYLGCIVGQASPPISYDVSCLNSTAFDVQYYESSDCSGAIVHNAPISWEEGCTGSSDGKSTFEAVCLPGSFKAPKNAVNHYFFTTESSCPVTDLAYTGVVSTPIACIAPPAGTGPKSYTYGCDKSNVTIQTFFTSDCSGTGAPPSPVGALGCTKDDNKGGVIYTTCSAAPPPAAQKTQSLRGPTVSDSVRLLIEQGLARVREAVSRQQDVLAARK